MKKRLLSLVLGLSACLPLVSLGAQDIQARFEKSVKDATSLVDVEIECLDTLWLPHGIDRNSSEFSRTFQYSYLASGLKHRAACKLISGTQTNLVKMSKSAFDGTSYSYYDEDTRYMTRRNGTPSFDRALNAHSPLIAPFMFLPRGSYKYGPHALRFTDIRSDTLTKGFLLPTGQSSTGLLEISFSAPLSSGTEPLTWKVTIDEAGDSFTPKAITQSSPGSEIVYRLLNYTNLGTFQFPTRIEWSHTLYPRTAPPQLFQTGLVTVITARIPGQIADSMFRLDSEEKAATVVYNADEKYFTKSPHAASSSDASNRLRAKIYDESSDGSKQIADALAEARKERKHVLLQFGANWCSWCQKLHQLFATDKHTAEALKRDYVVVMIDMNNGHNKDTDKKYGNPTRFGLPAIVVLDTNGRQLTTQNSGTLMEGGQHSPEKVMAFLQEWSPTRSQ